jgi:hypothetical protein
MGVLIFATQDACFLAKFSGDWIIK